MSENIEIPTDLQSLSALKEFVAEIARANATAFSDSIDKKIKAMVYPRFDESQATLKEIEQAIASNESVNDCISLTDEIQIWATDKLSIAAYAVSKGAKVDHVKDRHFVVKAFFTQRECELRYANSDESKFNARLIELNQLRRD